MNHTDIPSYHRAHRNCLLRWFGRVILAIMGWRLEGQIPGDRKIIVAIAPHTSNWDFVVGLCALLALDLNIHWIGKHTMFKAPFLKLLMSVGGIPIDRSRPEGVVQQITDRMCREDQIIIGIMPEGTRKKVMHWKTGFLRIAKAAQCRVLLAALDYGQKSVFLGNIVEPQDDIEQQVRQIKHYYRKYQPKRPEWF